MYADIERRQPQKWVSRGRAGGKGNSQPAEAAGVRCCAAEPPAAKAPEAPFSRTDHETKRLRRELQVVTDANLELEAFNWTVSHDLCTPLTTINGYCQVLLSGMCSDQLDENSKEYLDAIYKSTLRMKQLIGSLLDFSRSTRVELHRECFDVSEMAQSVAEELKLTAPQRRVSFLIAEGISGNGDQGLWRSVMDNLIGNAWKYSVDRVGTVIEFGSSQLEGKQVFFVRDNGPGFDMEFAEQLFVPFTRIPGSVVEGKGIGLATVDRIVRRHGGRIWGESIPNQGATFFFTME